MEKTTTHNEKKTILNIKKIDQRKKKYKQHDKKHMKINWIGKPKKEIKDLKKVRITENNLNSRKRTNWVNKDRKLLLNLKMKMKKDLNELKKLFKFTLKQ